MILDTIENMENYQNLNTDFEKAFDFLTKTDLSTLKIGRHDIDGDNIYALIQEYETTELEDRYLETHDLYADLQYVLSGKESMYFADSKCIFQIKEEYSPTSDATLFHKTEDLTKCIMTDGDFVIFFPGEYHIPQCKFNNPSKVFKIVIKSFLNTYDNISIFI